ncbi:MAG TPA: serine hydrolase domain-containing protein [Burkholderiales bacterium]|nr:serine hydrolase domain-containing protein [Burkholderiales bacterium]
MSAFRGFVWSSILAFSTAAVTSAADLPTASPEALGFSSQRLARIGPVINGEIEKGQYPGAVILVARKGKVVYFDTFGQLDPASGKPMPKDAIFRLYSMTKPYTSVAAMMLMEEGKLRLTDPVSRYIPAFANLQVSVPATDPYTGATKYVNVPADREVNIQDLLRHTSGFVYGPYTSHPKVKELYAKEGVDWKDVTPAEQIERLAKVPLAHQPGTTFEYSLSVDVLGRVIEAISGMTLSQFLQERIFMPLAMTDSAFIVPPEKRDRLAQPFATDKATNTPINLLDVTLPQKNDAGGAGSVGTAADYARFLQMLINGGHLDGVRLLSPTTVRYMTADHLGPDIKFSGVTTLPAGTGFGLGFAVRRETGRFEVTGNAGEYYWAGAAGTGFYVDPTEELICVWMTQGQPGMARRYDRYLFKQMVYQAINY